jgi:hypothetical protein
MKRKQLKWLADFIVMFPVFLAGTSVTKLHAAGQPVFWVVLEAFIVATLISFFNYIRKHGDD